MCVTSQDQQTTNVLLLVIVMCNKSAVSTNFKIIKWFSQDHTVNKW